MSYSNTPASAKASMSSENLRLLAVLAPKIPMMLKTTLFHVLHLSEQSKYLDLKEELTVNVVRAFLTPSGKSLFSISATQKFLAKDPGPSGRIWVSTYVAPADEGVAKAITAALIGLVPKNAPATEDMLAALKQELAPSAPVEAEWTGYRAGVADDAKLPSGMSQRALYDEMMKEVSAPSTVLYFHGGAYWLMDPATHRPLAKKLAKLTKGRVYSVRYRLSPKHAFPAALIDAMVSYLALLYPPEDAFHAPVEAKDIIFSGDSAGGNLSLSLLQTLLYLQRNNLTVTWQGESRHVPLPGGVALNSPWTDLTHSSPSCDENASWDYLPAPLSKNYHIDSIRPECEIWPANPPRRSVYVDDHLCDHPLVTVLLAESWKGSPPVYICTGWELLADENKYMAVKLRKDGVKVVFEEYEGMPHCFALIFPESKGARRCLTGWSGFINRVVNEKGDGEKGGQVESEFKRIRAKTLEEVDLEGEGEGEGEGQEGWMKIAPYSEEEIRRRIGERMRRAREEGVVGIVAKL
ncbi:alpha/beta hydrolase fold domain containing protein [Naviculisporaceae sp. PSN 640]